MERNDKAAIEALLKRHGFHFSKSMGQNFLIDPSVCPRMAAALEADDRTGVLEIGPGIGVLTKELSAVCGRVTAVELDRRLPDVLAETLAACPNVLVVSGDVLIAGSSLHENDAIGLTGLEYADVEAETDAKILVIEVPMRQWSNSSEG